MQDFTIIGFYEDTQQRFCEAVQAPDALRAEAVCQIDFPSVTICGVIAGRHHCLDDSPTIGRQHR